MLNTTKYLSFAWAGPTPLAAELRRPIKQVSLEFPIPNTAPNEDNKITYKECLLAIKRRFDSESVEIDASLSEPEQIIRLWGTLNRRDPETEGRPHRQSAIIAKARGAVSLARLGLLACE